MYQIFSKTFQISPRLLALVLLSGFCVLLISFRMIRTSSFTYMFLGWNLFLAWVPLLVARIWQYRQQQGPLQHWKTIVLFCIWLLFFPNAPYIITDLAHLNKRINTNIWSDSLLLFSCAMAGLSAGLYALHLVHENLSQYFTKYKTWIIIIGSLVVSSFGIFLGRIQRWNSWDVFTNPIQLCIDIAAQLTNPLAIRMTIGYSALMILVYVLLKTLISHEKNHQ